MDGLDKNGSVSALVRTEASYSVIELLSIAKEEHLAGVASVKSGLEHYKKAGEALAQIRTLLREGKVVGYRRMEWGRWLRENFDGKARSANNYVRIAEQWDLVESKGIETLREALVVLVHKKKENKPLDTPAATEEGVQTTPNKKKTKQKKPPSILDRDDFTRSVKRTFKQDQKLKDGKRLVLVEKDRLEDLRKECKEKEPDVYKWIGQELLPLDNQENPEEDPNSKRRVEERSIHMKIVSDTFDYYEGRIKELEWRSRVRTNRNELCSLKSTPVSASLSVS